jgi:hypothetical protein
MAAVPPAILVVSAARGGLYWITKRRNQMMSQAANAPKEQHPELDEGKEG